ncbi:GDSL-type esterase/lipase family protein [Candidatus Sodalis pierantonius]|uniref:GDSL-type esterase/lipase family protein n=1 Tax=Candidatus Sodalis pierantonii TaxID=1486991 RepID=UPI0011DCBA5D|nr:GDSL-type esterase/lipase family protein [Candidatus Sodalis pierantonius]
MNFKNVFRWHFLFLILLSLVSVRALAADTLLVLGDSLNAGYRMPAARAWPALLRQHKPRWVVIELGGNDGLRGFPPSQIEQDLVKAITLSQQAGAQPLLMQIRLPPNYGKRYTETISAIYPALASRYAVPLLPFFMEQVYLRPEWMQDNGIHPNPDAQPFIAQWMADRLLPLLKHES